MLPLALSPCPNDTFLFHAWLHGLVGQDFPLNPHFADIHQLNQWALEKKFPFLKVSLSCLGKISEDYFLLPTGSAMGYGCGPKIIAKRHFSLEDLANRSIAIPGQETTAHLLLQTLAPSPQEKCFCLYNEIAELLHSDRVDCGLIIHESRFTFEQEGFVEIADLGKLWEDRFQLPLPLGGLVLRRDFPEKDIPQIVRLVRESLAYAWQYPGHSEAFIQSKAQEKERTVVQKHIDLYVSKETYSLSKKGEKAIRTLLACGEKMGWYRTKTFEKILAQVS